MYNGTSYFTNVAVPKTADRVLELIFAPATNPDMFWLVIPLLAVTIFMTFYFGRHKYEDLGWNTATSNSLVLMFVSIDLLRYIYYTIEGGSFQSYLLYPAESLISLGILVFALSMITANYHHKIMKKVAFFVSSPLTVNTIAYVVMAIVYTWVPADYTTLFAGIALFFIILVFLKLLQLIQELMLKHEEIEKTNAGEETLSEENISELEEEIAEKQAELEEAKAERLKIKAEAEVVKEKRLRKKEEKEKELREKKKKLIEKAKEMGLEIERESIEKLKEIGKDSKRKLTKLKKHKPSKKSRSK